MHKNRNVMKINWGTGIVIAFLSFMSFILYFIITMSTDKKYDYDLVVEDYYGQELEFQNDLNKETTAATLTHNITWKKTENGIEILFPEEFESEKITGKVFLYRPSNKQFDFETLISLSKNHLLIPDKRLLDGRWNIKIDWSYEGKDYMYKKEIIY